MKKVKLFLVLALLVLNAFAVTAAEFEADANTVALWHFNEGVGTSLLDETVNNNDGTLMGVPAWTNNSFSGTALDFDGVDDRVQITKTTSIDLTDEVTLEAHIERQSTADGSIVAKNGPYFLAVKNNKLEGGIFADAGAGNTWTFLSGATTLAQDTDYEVALVYDGATMKLFVDGVEDASIAKSGTMPQVSQKINIGWGEPGLPGYFNGIIDEVRISDIGRVVSPPQPPGPTLEERVEDLEASMTTAEGDIGVLETQTAGFNTSIGTLETDVSALQTDLTTLQTTVTNLGITVATLVTDVAGLVTDVIDLETSVGVLETTVSAQGTAITALETAVSDLETALADVVADVALVIDFLLNDLPNGFNFEM